MKWRALVIIFSVLSFGIGFFSGDYYSEKEKLSQFYTISIQESERSVTISIVLLEKFYSGDIEGLEKDLMGLLSIGLASHIVLAGNQEAIGISQKTADLIERSSNFRDYYNITNSVKTYEELLLAIEKKEREVLGSD